MEYRKQSRWCVFSDADTSWDLIIAIQPDGSKMAFLTGQATKPQEIPYEKEVVRSLYRLRRVPTCQNILATHSR